MEESTYTNFSPQLFFLNDEKDNDLWHKFIKSRENVIYYDAYERQLVEFYKNKTVAIERTYDQWLEVIRQDLKDNGQNIDNLGVVVFYPWKNKAIRIVEEEKFVFIRTIRNQYKITPEQQSVLRKKRLGVIGLSVGNSIALTLCMERLCGEIVIADFDELELSNMNRIRAGLHNLGINKAVITARQISEIDPYIKVRVLTEGLTKQNVEKFFGKNEDQIDIIIEECDSIDIKILARKEAAKRKIALIMDTSDRGMIDIERYDLSEKKLFHGLVDQNFLDHIDSLTEEQRRMLLEQVISVEDLSPEMKNSMIEIGKSIRSWPQLASSIMLGAGVTGYATRKILLGDDKLSGRYYVDLNLILNKYKAIMN